MRKGPVAYQHRMRSPQVFPIDGANFDGSVDWLNKTTTHGAADGKQGILSFWLRMLGGDGSSRNIWACGANKMRFIVKREVGNTITFQGNDPAGLNPVTRLFLPPNQVMSSATGWHHFLAMWDLNVGAAASGVWVDDAPDSMTTGAGIPFYSVGNNIGYSVDVNAYFGGTDTGTVLGNFDIADFYLAFNQYLDFNIYTNRRRFISSIRKPVKLGGTGSDPTGTSPTVFCRLADGEAPANFALNRGTGGNYTVTGALTTSSTSPSD